MALRSLEVRRNIATKVYNYINKKNKISKFDVDAVASWQMKKQAKLSWNASENFKFASYSYAAIILSKRLMKTIMGERLFCPP